ncbi:hypothetical protein [Aeromicrobium sp. UC242_57]|uniref:hypothetical protein n=1 Tax=Aeromicrobium sp. UC242_57 TaxID=3374624 RepID=UPI0037B75BDC
MSTDWEHTPSPGRRGQQIAFAGAGVLLVFGLLSMWFVMGPGFGADKAHVQTTAGFGQLVVDARDGLGTTEVLEASLFETYAMVEVPVQGVQDGPSRINTTVTSTTCSRRGKETLTRRR